MYLFNQLVGYIKIVVFTKMNRFRRQLAQKEDPSDKENDLFHQLKDCQDKLRDMSDILKNLSNKL